MNKYVKNAICIPYGAMKNIWTKLFHPLNFNGTLLCYASLSSEITIDHGGMLSIGKMFKIRNGAKVTVRKDGKCKIGHHCFINSNSLIVCHNNIQIGDYCQISPHVQIYDHDHDFRDREGLKSKKYKCESVIIGSNVWIGAESVVLRGTIIGDNCVIGAGSVIKGSIPSNTVVVQKRNTILKERNNKCENKLTS